jgi:ABC-type multidrug transport system ATPase subunit
MGKTIVATIHQPSSDIFFLFDELLLLSQGQVMYQGSIQSVVSYFARFGYQCPQYTNPSDYIFMNILNEDESLTKNGSDNANLKLLEKWHKTEESYSIMTEIKSASKEGELKLSKKAYTEFTTQVKLFFLKFLKLILSV